MTLTGTNPQSIDPVVRRRDMPRDDDGGFHRTWFPIALSAEVGSGDLIGREVLDGKVVVFRSEGGDVQVLSAYCRHLGADLSVGSVVDDCVRCAFHHWDYDSTGAVVRTAAGDKVPSASRLFAFPTVEQWGIIWFFNGSDPDFNPPTFRDVEPDSLPCKAVEMGHDLTVDTTVLLANAVDFQHLHVVHGLEIDMPADVTPSGQVVDFEGLITSPEMGTMEARIRIHGPNTFLMSSTIETPGGPMTTHEMGAMVPVPGGCRGFSVFSTDLQADDATVFGTIDGLHAFAQRLQAEDLPILDSIHFRPDTLTSSDKALAKFLQFVREFPRSTEALGLLN